MSEILDITISDETITGNGEETIDIEVVEESIVSKFDGDITVTITEDVIAPVVDDALDITISEETISAAPDEVLEFKIDEVIVINEGGAGSTYTGTAERDVGGISDTQVFTDANMAEMWDSLIKQEKFPSLSNPSSSFSSSSTGYHEIGELIGTITFNVSFSQGSISPQYTAASPFRSGLPNQYNYSGSGLSNQASISLTDQQTISNYTVLINGQSWTCNVSYDAGVQPKSSYDNDFNTPLAAGNTATDTQTITGVYPYYGTTFVVGTLTKRPLTSMTATYVQLDMVAEDGIDKQKAEFPQAWSAINGIQFFNTVSNTWEFIGGNAANSLLTFTKTASTETIQGSVVNYWTYAHNGPTIGARQTRWFTN